MPDLTFAVEGVEAVAFAASPLLHLKLRVTQTADRASDLWAIHNILLRCQVRIEPTRRRYEVGNQARLRELFGEPERWGQTMRSMLWTHTSVIVPAFRDSLAVDLPLPCTYDFNVAATKYFDALDDGEVPLTLLFSGTIFHAGTEGLLQVAQISWEKEATFRLPVQVWKDMMELYYPQVAWLCLRKEVFDRLHRYKVDRGLPTWEQALERLLTAEGEARP